jgi:hypothetical protein
MAVRQAAPIDASAKEADGRDRVRVSMDIGPEL